MSSTASLQLVPRIARYKREPLDDRQNALSFWAEAAESMVPLEDDRLYEELVYGNPETGKVAPFPTDEHKSRIRRFLEDNSRALGLLRQGISCERLQFPEPEEEGEIDESAESLLLLVHLANTWFIHARFLRADDQLTLAAEELIGLGQMGHMICCGEGFVVHYLVGCSVMGTAMGGISLLCKADLSASVATGLSAAIREWLAGAGSVAECLRVELCDHVLQEIDRLSDRDSLEEMVDELLNRHYANAPMMASETVAACAEDEGRLAWRRNGILRLLKDHPAPFNKIATVRLVSRLVADRIWELQPQRLALLAPWRRVVASLRGSRFRYESMKWPAQLCPGFPYEYLGPGEGTRRELAELKEQLPAGHWARMQLPSDMELEIARERLRSVPNAFGLLVADALLPTDIRHSEQLRRERLKATKAAVDAFRG